MKKFYLLLLFTLLYVFSGCEYKPQSAGDDDKISVMMDTTQMGSWGEAVKEVFGTIKDYPNPEREFQIQFYPYEKFREWSVQKNLLMVGYLDGKDSVSAMLSRMLKPELKEDIRNGKYFYFRKQDVWARDQLVMYLIGRDPIDVEIQLINLKKQIITDFRNYYYAKLFRQMYARAEQKDLEKEMFKKFDFVFRVQHDYKLVAANKRDNIYWIRRPLIDRNLFVHWLDKDSGFVNPDSIIAERNRIARKYFEGDYVSQRYLNHFKVTFAGHKALKIEGVWENRKHYIGGPFRTYAFYDRRLKKVFMVDIFAFIPNRRKKYYLDQLEVMANTFRLKYQMNSLEDLWKD